MALLPSDPGYCPAPSYAFPSGQHIPQVTYLPERPACRHDVSGDCEVHGCPYCQDEREQKPWIDPCQSCVQLRDAAHNAFLALNPVIECEERDHLVCTSCLLCYETGRVCRVCDQCIDCARDGGSEECEIERWDPRTGETHLIGFSHDLWDPTTGRW